MNFFQAQDDARKKTLWLALLFTGTLGVGRTFAREAEDGAGDLTYTIVGGTEVTALMRQVIEQFGNYAKLDKSSGDDSETMKQ